MRAKQDGVELGAKDTDMHVKKASRSLRKGSTLKTRDERAEAGSTTVTFRCSKVTHAYLKRLAVERGSKIGEVVRDSVTLERELRGRLRRFQKELEVYATERDLSIDRNLAELLERLTETATASKKV